MKVLIHWNIFANVGSESKCHKVVANIEAALGLPLSSPKIERYRKDQTMFKILADTSITVPNVEDAVFKVITKAGRLSRAWVVSAPSEDSALKFGGASQPGSVAIQGIDSISFSVSEDVPQPVVHCA